VPVKEGLRVSKIRRECAEGRYETHEGERQYDTHRGYQGSKRGQGEHERTVAALEEGKVLLDSPATYATAERWKRPRKDSTSGGSCAID